jgi:hypothetical protein
MTWLEGLNLAAIFLGPIGALQVSAWLERRRSHRERQLSVYRALMATRATPTSPQHVEALNTIDVEFSRSGKAEQAVRRSLKDLLLSLEVPMGGNVDVHVFERRRDRHSS